MARKASFQSFALAGGRSRTIASTRGYASVTCYQNVAPPALLSKPHCTSAPLALPPDGDDPTGSSGTGQPSLGAWSPRCSQRERPGEGQDNPRLPGSAGRLQRQQRQALAQARHHERVPVRGEQRHDPDEQEGGAGTAISLHPLTRCRAVETTRPTISIVCYGGRGCALCTARS